MPRSVCVATGMSPCTSIDARPPDWIGKSPYSYWAVSACLVALAAWLRFYELSANSLWLDEALVATFTQGTLLESWELVRQRHSSPLLYPLILWLVQKGGELSLMRRDLRTD